MTYKVPPTEQVLRSPRGPKDPRLRRDYFARRTWAADNTAVARAVETAGVVVAVTLASPVLV